MTNTEIIFNEAIMNNIFTEEEAVKILESGAQLPLHTFANWKSLGYSVKKGEKAKIKTRLWKPVKAKKKDSEDGEKEMKMYLCKAALFTADQVQKIEEKI